MIRNFFLTSLRNFSKNKIYTFINVFGLTIGLASSIFILLFILTELSYDKYHKNADELYRMHIHGKLEGTDLNGAYTAVPSGGAFYEEIPEVVNFCRFKETGQRVLIHNNNRFIEEFFVYSDSSVFQMFDFHLLQGDPGKVLKEPNTIVINESTASKIFGKTDPINQMIAVNADSNLYRVTGIMKDLPENTHFKFNVLASYHTLDESERIHWLSNNIFTYLQLKEGTKKTVAEQKMKEVSGKYIEAQLMEILGITIKEFEAKGNFYGIKLQNLTDIHLNNQIPGGFKPPHDRKYLVIFSFVAILILVIASINFMNLSTAKSANRAKEVGMRKVLGSTKKQIVTQFLWESIVISLLSLIFSLIIVELLMPSFNKLTGLNMNIDFFSQWYIIPILLLLAFFIGILSGSYPSFVLSSYKPVEVLKGQMTKGIRGGNLRNILVILQFSISIIIIIGTIVVYNQLSFMLNKDLGYSKDQQLILDRVWPLDSKMQTFVQELEKLPGVETVSNSTAHPGIINNNNGYQIKGRDRAKTYLMITNYTDYDYLKTFDIKLDTGRFLQKQFSSDSTAAVINQTAVREFGLTNPLNTIIQKPSENGEPEEIRVIGVVEDFHLSTLRSPIRPAVFMLKKEWWDWGGYINVKLNSQEKSYRNTVNQIEQKWKEFLPDEPFLFYFLDEKLENMYTEEQRTAKISLIFSILAIIIASLGLFGLTLFTTEKKTREIGIRKVMGATVPKIILLILRNISILMVIATVVSWVASYKIMQNWLQDFPYKSDLSIWIFVLSALIAFSVAIITVSTQAYRAAIANPARSLRHE